MAPTLKTLTRTSRGPLVERFQDMLNERLEHIPGGKRYKLKPDGDFGAKTFETWQFIKPWMGFLPSQKPTPRAQWNLMHPDSRSKAAKARARKYRDRPRFDVKPLKVHIVRNKSSRNGVTPRIIVLHVTEGGTLESVRNWFNNPTSQASSNHGNDAQGNRELWVRDEDKAWTQAQYNPQALSIEQCGFSAQKVWPEAQLVATAASIAAWSKKYGIPIKFSTTHGVCEHKHLGSAGGNHGDCGPNYPFERVLDMARRMK